MTITAASAVKVLLHEHVANHAAHHATDKSTEKGVVGVSGGLVDANHNKGGRPHKLRKGRWVLYRLDAHELPP
jgi:hypothetical protein